MRHSKGALEVLHLRTKNVGGALKDGNYRIIDLTLNREVLRLKIKILHIEH
jgi:hypothetical protein